MHERGGLLDRLRDCEAGLQAKADEARKARDVQRDLQEELEQWKRYAIRCQQENTEIQKKSVLCSPRPSACSGPRKSPIRHPLAQDGPLPSSQDHPCRKSLESLEVLIQRLARAEEAWEGKTTNSDALNQSVKRLLAERLQHEAELGSLRREVQQAYEENKRLRGGAKLRSTKVRSEAVRYRQAFCSPCSC
jgi:hypothetical protein